MRCIYNQTLGYTQSCIVLCPLISLCNTGQACLHTPSISYTRVILKAQTAGSFQAAVEMENKKELHNGVSLYSLPPSLIPWRGWGFL